MKNKTKILTSFILLLTMIFGMLSIGSYAADETIIYLTPNSNWTKDNARFAMYVWTNDTDHKWIDMTDSNNDGIYEGVLPAGYTKIIFCRLKPDDTHNGWSTTWNQTNDLVYDGTNNHYKIASEAWSNGEGSWTVFDSNACAHSYEKDVCTKCGEELYYIIAGNVAKIDGEYREGDNSTLFITKWDVTDENNRMLYDEESGCYVKIYENVAKGEYHFKIAENKSWDISYGKDGGNFHLVVEEDGSTVVISLKEGNVSFAARVLQNPIEKPNDSNNSNDSVNTETPDDSGNNESNNNDSEVKLNFFQKIWQAILNFFKNLFGGKK